MFSIGEVIEAPTPAEATARYWVWRASESGSPEAELVIRAKVNQAEVGVRGQVFTGDPVKEVLADGIVRHHGTALNPAGRLAVYQALLDDLELGLKEERADEFGVHYQTDYSPVGRLADVLREVDCTGLPIKTQSYTYPNFAYVTEQGEPITIINGDTSLAQTHIVNRHSVPLARIAILSVPVG